MMILYTIEASYYSLFYAPVNEGLFLLSDPVNPSNGLELLGRVQQRLHQDHPAGFYQVQTVGSLAQRHQQDLHVIPVLKVKSL